MKKSIIAIITIAVAIAGLIIWQVEKSVTKVPASTSSVQVLPVESNPIKNTAEQPGLAITAANVEDNVDPATKQPIPDRLQISLQNKSTQPMSNLEIYYQMKDTKTGRVEGYYQKLTGLQFAANETKTIYFDDQTGSGHYPENKYSLYRSSQNQVDFTIQVSAPGFKIATGTAKKSAGTGETAG